MAYPEPINLDGIYGPADKDKEFVTCEQCEQEWPATELSSGICPDCRLRAHYEARMRREEYRRIVDGLFEIPDADPGL